MDKAIEDLRKASGLKAAKKASRVAAEGIVMTKIAEDGNYGVVVEINSETDFVARTEGFQDFSRDIAMHIAATAPLAVRREDISADIISKEKEIFKDQALQSGKPENIAEKMVEGPCAAP